MIFRPVPEQVVTLILMRNYFEEISFAWAKFDILMYILRDNSKKYALLLCTAQKWVLEYYTDHILKESLSLVWV